MPAVSLDQQRFTRGEKIILEVLSDGRGHTLKELRQCLFDELSGDRAVTEAVFRLKKKLRPVGHDIVTVMFAKKIYYQHILLLRTGDD